MYQLIYLFDQELSQKRRGIYYNNEKADLQKDFVGIKFTLSVENLQSRQKITGQAVCSVYLKIFKTNHQKNKRRAELLFKYFLTVNL